MFISLDTYPNKGGCVVHLADHEIREILDDLATCYASASTDELKRQLENYLESKEDGA